MKFNRGLLTLIFCFLHFTFNYSASPKSSPKPSPPTDNCSVCAIIAEKFLQGVSKTSKSNFGGGNTRWEEENLGKYVFSETRFIEIVENICVGESKQCHQMLEVHEELLDMWWKKFYARRIESDLKDFLCVRRLKVCCPRGTFGPECSDCKGGRKIPCNGNGRCDGDGTKEGTGECKCDVGYEGLLCQTCSTGFYEDKNEKEVEPLLYRPTCLPCHQSCGLKCKGQGAQGCHTCKDGWVMMDGVGCSDLNECDDVSMCPRSEFCINTEGSYKCMACHKACEMCKGSDVNDCITCSIRYFRDANNTCTACHESCSRSCSDQTSRSCDHCKKGWKADEEGVCQDINECKTADIPLRCSSDEYCINNIGSYACSTCHPNCNGCHGAGNNKCTKCKDGYKNNGDDDSCIDVDECQKANEACPGSNNKCVNLPGGYRCDCLPGFKMQAGLCVHSSKAGGSDSERDSSLHHPSPTNKKKSSNEAKKVKKKKIPLYKRELPQYLVRLAGFTIACSITKRKLLIQSIITATFAAYLYYYANELDGSYVKP